MSGRIPKEFISELLMRVDIVDVINSHVPLKKSGANYVARCPFHLEKTPSFSVSRKKQFFHCFGCGASGNVIGFLMDFNRLDFVEAVEDLALFAGLPVPKEEGLGYRANVPKLNELQTLLASVAEYYIEQLRVQQAGKQAVAYLKKRGINSQYATEYKLGYAPFEWQELTDKFNQDLLLMAGVLGVNDDDKRVYGRFRHRVMFPIRSKRGNVIGFGGRVLDDSMPKYLNSPETVLFHKSQEVYGLYELLARNAKPVRILVVEGYMDVIALAQFGVGYAVAALGTALTEQHINLLFRFSAEIVLCFDGDKAGRMAAWKAMDVLFPCLKDDRQVKVMLLPLEHDPDSIIRAEGVNAFILRIEQATVLSDYFFAQLSEHLDLQTVEGCSQLTLKAEPYLQKMPDGLLKDMMFQRLGQLANFKVARKKLTVKNLNKKNVSAKVGLVRPSLKRLVLAMLIQYPQLQKVLEQHPVDLAEFEFSGAEKFKEIFNHIVTLRSNSPAILLEDYRGHSDELIIKQLAALVIDVPAEGLEAEFMGAIDKLLAESRDYRFKRLSNKLEKTGLNEEEKKEFTRLSMMK